MLDIIAFAFLLTGGDGGKMQWCFQDLWCIHTCGQRWVKFKAWWLGVVDTEGHL